MADPDWAAYWFNCRVLDVYKRQTLYGFLFDVEEQYQQDMENYLMRDTDVSYNSISTLKANVLGIKNVVLLVGGMIGAVFALVGPVSYTHLAAGIAMRTAHCPSISRK